MSEPNYDKFQWYVLTTAVAMAVALIGWWGMSLDNRVHALENSEPVAIVNGVKLQQALDDIAEIKADLKEIKLSLHVP